MDLLVNHSTDPAFNLALEELIASDYPREALMLWRNEPAIIVGCNQNTEAEINAAFVREHSIHVVRRITGGGAVYHDLGNVNYTVAANDRQLDPAAFARNAQVVLDVLRRFGVAAEFSGRNDILVDGRKISGSAKSVLRNRTLFHATLLFDVDLDVLTHALNPDKDKILAKGIKSVRSRVANLREYLPEWDTNRFLAELEHALRGALGTPQCAEIPEALIEKAQRIANEKYRTWEWNYGSRHTYSFEKSGRFSCGGVRVAFNVVENRIADLKFTGDFFGIRNAAELAAKLNGLEPRFDVIAKTLNTLAPEEYIQGITTPELLTLFSL